MRDADALNAYIARFRRRLINRQWTVGIAAAAVAGVAVLALGAFIAVRLGFADSVVNSGRLALVLTLIAAFVAVGWWPVRRLRRRAIERIEARTPALNGRIETFTAMATDEPLRPLLASETLDVAQRFPPERQVHSREFTLPWLTTLAAVVLLGLTIAIGPGNFGHAVRHLLAGWAIDGLTPPQTLVVTPGDETVRRGASLRIVAAAEGFDPDSARLFVATGDEPWREVTMRSGQQGFERTLFSVRAATRYYVRAGAVRSETFAIDVVDLPDIDALRLTYTFPEWTGREPLVVEPGGDIRAVDGTTVTIEMLTDEPLPGAELVIDGTATRADTSTVPARVETVVTTDAEYHIAARVGDEAVRLTDNYFITVEQDAAPDVRFARPGRDWKASGIEEVTTRLEVDDDFRIDAVALHFSVNGGDWTQIDYTPDGASFESDHTFFSESLGDGEQPLAPGDLVSYYAEAKDRDRTARTDIYFIDVQPFDQRYSQSQQAGGGGGGEIGDEISERQREIIVSTYNLIREQEAARRDDTFIDDNARLLSELQETLRNQALSLAERSRARQLADDAEIERFIEHLEDAAESMQPASERLAAVDFRDALAPEQQALQQLLRAEAVFRDISVSMRNDGNPAGGQAGRDLSEMFELEMDLEKNQYETGSQATAAQEDQELDEIAEKLAELAERQQQLADRLARDGQATPAERWRQEQLRREAEQLQRELEQLSRSSNSSSDPNASQNASSGQSADGEPQPEQPESSEEQQASNERSNSERRQEQLERRVDNALEAMRASDEALADRSGDTDAAADAAAEAGRALDGATQAASEAAQEALNERLAEFEAQARELLATQRDSEATLAEALTRADGFFDGLSEAERAELIEQKRLMQADLAELAQAMKATARNLRSDDPARAGELEQGLERLADDAIDERLALAALYIEQGDAQYVAGSESLVTAALEELTRRTDRAAARRSNETQPGNPAREALASTRELRAELEALERGEASGEITAETGSLGGRDRALRGEVRANDVLLPSGMDIADDLERAAAEIRQTATGAANALELTAEEAQALRAFARELNAAAATARNEQIVESEFRRVVELLDQVELTLAPALAEGTDGVRVLTPEVIEARHRDAVAEYYRRLADGAATDSER
ncbi:MAG: DUF4175 family protein [Pseudomonadota bacterium]